MLPWLLLISTVLAVLLLLLLAVVVKAYNFLLQWSISADLERRRCRKQKELNEAKRQFAEQLAQQEMSEVELGSILDCSTAQLVQRLREGRLQPERVLLAYQKAALAVDRRLNCVVEFLQPDWRTINLRGPLAGLPVSLKEGLRLRDRDSCVGCSALIGRPADTDCRPVAALKALGAVPFVRTVVPQSEMSILSSNPINGATKHPQFPERSPGGSSSGEAALVASTGSPLGIGTDLGGSVRLPAAWCGCVGFKPTYGRLTGLGFTSAVSGQCLLPPSWGPLGPDVAAVETLMSALCQIHSPQYDIEPELPPLGWNAAEAEAGGRSLRIGYFVDGGLFDVLPCMRRAVAETKKSLEARGHDLVEWQPPTAPYFEIFLRCIFSDGGSRFVSVLKGDRTSASVRRKLKTLSSPSWLRRIRAKLDATLGRSQSSFWLDCSAGPASVDSLWTLQERLADIRHRFWTAFRASGLDALICPAGGCPAAHLIPTRGFAGAAVHFNLFNTVNCPAGTVPVTRVSPADMESLSSFPRSKSSEHTSVADMQYGALGLPVSVQCVAPPWREETCVRLMAEVETAMRPVQV